MTFEEWLESNYPKGALRRGEHWTMEEILKLMQEAYEAGYFKGVEDEHKNYSKNRGYPF